MRSELKSKVKSHLVGMWDLNSDLRGYKSKTGDFNGGTQGFSETKEAIEVALATEATVAIEAIEAIQAWGASWRSRRVQTLLVRFLLAPLEFPKLANAQPSNFGPLRMLKMFHLLSNSKSEAIFVICFPIILAIFSGKELMSLLKLQLLQKRDKQRKAKQKILF